MKRTKQTITNFNSTTMTGLKIIAQLKIIAGLKVLGLIAIVAGLTSPHGIYAAAYNPGYGGRAPDRPAGRAPGRGGAGYGPDRGAGYNPAAGAQAPIQPQSPYANQPNPLQQFKALQIRPDIAKQLLPQEIEKKSSLITEVTPSGIRMRKEAHTSFFHYGYQGQRNEMQDDHSEAISQRFDFFTVCDGHGTQGLFAAQTCAGYLYSKVYRLIAEASQRVARLGKGEVSRSAALQGAFASMDQKFLTFPQSNFGGTTVAIALVDKLTHEVYFAHVGDTRALLCSTDSGILFATHDHSFTDMEEWNRITSAGGVIIRLAVGEPASIVDSIERAKALSSKALYVSARNDLEHCLNMPRSIESQFFKNIGVSAEPTISGPIALPANGFLIIACDGVWDVLSNEIAYDTVKSALTQGKTEQQAAYELASRALANGSTDNISVTVVYLNKYTTPIQAP